jgi:hypothetical protein
VKEMKREKGRERREDGRGEEIGGLKMTFVCLLVLYYVRE